MALLPASLDASSNDKSNSDGSSSSKTSQAQSSQPTQQKQASAPVKSASAPVNPAPSSNNSKPVVRASTTSAPAVTQSSSDKAAQIAAIQSQVQALQKQVTAAQNAGYGANDQIRYDSKGNVAPKATSQSTNTYSSNPAPSSSSTSSSKSTAQSSSSRSPGVSTSSSPTITHQSAPASPSIVSTANGKSASSGYTVQKGDTLANIAYQNGMTANQLKALNPQIADPTKIYPGEKINFGNSSQPSGATSYTTSNAPKTTNSTIPFVATTTAQSTAPTKLPSASNSSSPGFQFTPIAQSAPSASSNANARATTYTVKKGDTIGNLTANNNMTSAQFFALNPQFRNNPDRIGVGDQIKLTSTKTVGPTIPYVSVANSIPTTSQATAHTTASTKSQSTPYSSSPTFQFTPVSQSTTSSSINTNAGGSSYTVKKGDTLANGPASRNMTRAQLLALNPQYKPNPNLIGVGDQVQLSTPKGTNFPVVSQNQFSYNAANNTTTANSTIPISPTALDPNYVQRTTINTPFGYKETTTWPFILKKETTTCVGLNKNYDLQVPLTPTPVAPSVQIGASAFAGMCTIETIDHGNITQKTVPLSQVEGSASAGLNAFGIADAGYKVSKNFTLGYNNDTGKMEIETETCNGVSAEISSAKIGLDVSAEYFQGTCRPQTTNGAEGGGGAE